MRKIKTILFTIILIFAGVNAFSQDYMDEIAKKVCEKVENMPDTLSQEEMHMQLGLFMLELSLPYQKNLRKDYGIDLDKIDTQGEELGRILGLKMAAICPALLMQLASGSGDEEDVAESSLKGVVTKIDESQFVIFSVRDEKGKISKFYWLTFIESQMEMSSEYKSLNGEYVNITYFTQEFFDPRIGEYRDFNIIENIEIVIE